MSAHERRFRSRTKTEARTLQPIRNLHKHLHWVPGIYILALAELRYIRVKGDEGVSRTQVQRVVDAPVDLFRK